MSAFTIRPAEFADRWAIYRLIWSARLNPTGLAWRRFLVAVDGTGQIVACGQIKPHRDGSHELASIAVSLEWRHKGIASALIQQLLDIAPGELYLTCRSTLAPFYTRFGFQTIISDVMPPYFRRIERLARLIRRLNKSEETLLVMKRLGKL